MAMLLVVMVMSLCGLAGAVERPRLRGNEAPRATDLLRAETLAGQAAQRLRMPPHEGPGWKHGGTGWDEPSARPPAESSPVTIRLTPPRRRLPPR